MPAPPLSIDIRHPLMLKANELVLLTREEGDIPRDVPGLGLFYRDTCYLGGYELRLSDTKPLLLMSADGEGIAAQIELTNSALPTACGTQIKDHALTVRRALSLREEGTTFLEAISVTSFADHPIVLPLSIDFHTTFESMFVLRGAPPGKRGRLYVPAWEGGVLRFAYDGADGVQRTLCADFSIEPLVAPRACARTVAHFQIALAPRAPQELLIRLRVDERPTEGRKPACSAAPPIPNARAMRADARAEKARLLEGYARLDSPSVLLARVVARSLADIALLEVRRGTERFTAAGVPWFVGLFGRDSLLPALQCLAFNPDLGARTTRALSAWQGRREDAKTREEPGKIPHELRVGELAHLHEVPQTPSYAAVDSTLLYLVAIARHVHSTGDPALFMELRPQVDAALQWLERKLREGEGYVTYDGLAQNGQPVNQSWRDSGTGVLRADGEYPVPPLALVEVQGYAFQAMTLTADLLRRTGDPRRADGLDLAAGQLRERFLRDFWMPSEGCYCLALERGGRQVRSVTSNAAQVLWTGVATPEHAARIASRMMQPDMFSGWGVRTLSADHPAFDPLAYQQGSVWAFDNALIVSGLRRYGEDHAALRIAGAVLETANGFRLGRLPEFIAGNQREAGDDPVHTPRADPLQAWSAGAVPFMVTELLGLRADGFAQRLHVHRPLLPEGVDELSLRDLRVGGASLSLRVVRRGGTPQVEVLSAASPVDVIVDPNPQATPVDAHARPKAP